MQKKNGIAEAQFQWSASAGPLLLPVRWFAIISVVCWAEDQLTKRVVCPSLETDI
jgi:hypothetical protein